MATLVRPKSVLTTAANPGLNSNIPTPFPSVSERERLLREQLLEDLATEEVELHDQLQDQAGFNALQVSTDCASTSTDVQHELMPSIAYVQRSCIMTLNNLLHGSSNWHPIVPDRRHSMPSSPQSPTPPSDAAQSSSSAMQTLVSNLRNLDGGNLMIELPSADNDIALFHELRTRVETISTSLNEEDAELARALVALLFHFHRLSVIDASNATSRRQSAISHAWSPPDDTENLFDTLKQQLSDLQVERLTSQSDRTTVDYPPVLAVEKALLWSRIDEELETVLSMCKERADGLPRFSLHDHLPPQYDYPDYQYDTPPEYEFGTHLLAEDSKGRSQHSPSAAAGQSEKMRLDLEAVTMAIDRLYLVAPQLHNQRVELKSTKVEQMEKARHAGPASFSEASTAKGKGKEEDIREMENLLELLGRASDRTLKNQSVILEGGMSKHFERARLRDMSKRDAFVSRLVEHSDAGRHHQQDALRPIPKTKDPETLLTLPEFIREAIPDPWTISNPEASLTLPEPVNESPPPMVPQRPNLTRLKSKGTRHRSLSAPSLSWLRSSASKINLHSDSKSRLSGLGGSSSKQSAPFEVHYVAENHENLQHILVFFRITGATPGIDVEAEVLPSFTDSSEGDRVIIKNGVNISLPLILPARTTTGKKEVKAQSGHYEIKLTTLPFALLGQQPESVPLLDATQLSASNPTCFICTSCSLPLVQSYKIKDYRDLPSEHWEELVDAWMCHTDQNLHEQVAKHGRGFWPEPGQALVGGSYILFEESSLVKNNTCPADEPKRGNDWCLVRCLCGAVVGRCQEYQPGQGTTIVYRMLKYAIRPVSPTAEPSKIPLSAFIVEDMIEFVHAHATYRFVILDEENGKPRLLIWLFKPTLRVAYAMPNQYSLPKSGSFHAAKVLYKILGPATASTDMKTILNRYPGFPQAEYLYYPMSTCRRLAGLLRESNTAYPESLRSMTGLEVGWLHRA